MHRFPHALSTTALASIEYSILLHNRIMQMIDVSVCDPVAFGVSSIHMQNAIRFWLNSWNSSSIFACTFNDISKIVVVCLCVCCPIPSRSHSTQSISLSDHSYRCDIDLELANVLRINYIAGDMPVDAGLASFMFIELLLKLK